MARAPNPKKGLARQLYMRGYKLVDIAKELDVPDSTVRRWKLEDDWDKKNSSKKSKKRSKNNNERSKAKEKKNKKHIAEEVNEVIQNDELNDKQKLFCIYYVKCFNAVKAYKKAYKCKYATAAVSGSRLLKLPKIKEEIDNLKEAKLNRAFLTPEDIFQKYIDIAFADITDFIEFGTKEVEFITKEGGVGLIEDSYTNIVNADEVDGTLITEISNGKGGIKLKLVDRLKALEWLSAHMDMATDEQKAKIDKINADIELLKVRKEEVNSKTIL